MYLRKRNKGRENAESCKYIFNRYKQPAQPFFPTDEYVMALIKDVESHLRPPLHQVIPPLKVITQIL